MTAAAYGTLDVTDDRQVTDYERHFYDAYAGLPDKKLVRLIWEWDDTRQRLRTRIPYSDQVIYSARDTRGPGAGGDVHRRRGPLLPSVAASRPNRHGEPSSRRDAP